MSKVLRTVTRLAVVAVCFVWATTVTAQEAYPNKPIHLIVPFAPGGATDVLARLIGAQLSEPLGTQVIVENKPGAGTLVGAQAVAKSPADGYTLLMATSTTLAINPSLYRKLPYDPANDFQPVAMVASVPFVLVVNASSPARNVAELVNLARAQPLTFASAGSGTMHHLAAELFKTVTKIDAVHVPYKGSAPAVNDLLGGQVAMMFSDLAPALPHIASGRLRALAVTTDRRIAVLPDVPTIAESGYPGFTAVAWQSIVAPAATPKAIVSKLSHAINKLLTQPVVEQRILKVGMIPSPMPVEQLPGYVASEIGRWKPIVQASGAVAD